MVCCVLQLEELESLGAESMVVAAWGCWLYRTIQGVGSSLPVRLAPERIASSAETNIFQNTATGLEKTNHSNHNNSLRSVLSGTQSGRNRSQLTRWLRGRGCLLVAWCQEFELWNPHNRMRKLSVFWPPFPCCDKLWHVHTYTTHTHKQVNKWRNKIKNTDNYLHSLIETVYHNLGFRILFRYQILLK